jgi:hypothetical protein
MILFHLRPRHPDIRANRMEANARNVSKSTKTIDCIICGLTIGSGSRESYFGSLILSEDELSFINKETMRLVGNCP